VAELAANILADPRHACVYLSRPDWPGLIDVSAREADVLRAGPTLLDAVRLDAENRHPASLQHAQPALKAW
jgi:hypothetical protein